jgi:hypothetical protein
VSHAASGDGFGKIVTPLVILGVAGASWALRPSSRKLVSAAVNAPARTREVANDGALAVG